MIQHSLRAAVDDETISAEAAFAGLDADDLQRLAARHPGSTLLVRLRSERGDERMILSAASVEMWRRERVPRRHRNAWWYFEDVRDLLALASGGGL